MTQEEMNSVITNLVPQIVEEVDKYHSFYGERPNIMVVSLPVLQILKMHYGFFRESSGIQSFMGIRLNVIPDSEPYFMVGRSVQAQLYFSKGDDTHETFRRVCPKNDSKR